MIPLLFSGSSLGQVPFIAVVCMIQENLNFFICSLRPHLSKMYIVIYEIGVMNNLRLTVVNINQMRRLHH